MKTLISPSAMRDMEKRYFLETDIPSIDLMERAAYELSDAIIRRYGRARKVYFACGHGGNGGDGYACARLYAKAGGQCAIVTAATPQTADTAENLQRARAAGIEEFTPDDIPDAPEIWVDALYGTGLSRAPKGKAADLIHRMNADYAQGSIIVAVDIPSGLNGATGSAWLPCVRADVTVTFQLAKYGHFLGDGLDMCGELEIVDIGIPESFYPIDTAALIDDDDIRRALPPRPRNIHKGNCGHLLIVAGSFGMAGAAALCAQAALRTGIGLLTIACPASIVPVLQTLVPCTMCVPLPEENGAITRDAVDILAKKLSGKTAVVCGCGLSCFTAPEVIKLLLKNTRPTLFDADALNLIAQDAALQALLKPHHLITPHPGEAARLLGRAVVDPIGDAFALRAKNCQVLLKGAATVIPDECMIYASDNSADKERKIPARLAMISASGNCGMARGGSGDILSGIIGALMAEPSARSIAKCAAIGSELHGLAGARAQEMYGARGMCSQDIIQALPEVLMQYE